MKRLFPLLYLYIFIIIILFGCVPSATKRTYSKPSVPQAGKPILVIDTGGHKSKIQDVIFTSDGRYLVSASEDKTICVWDTSIGKIVRVLRGQIGEGVDGKNFAAALSPDDRLLAVGGRFHKNDRLKGSQIRLINFQIGEVKALLKGHKDVVTGLAFSPDGDRLISVGFDKTARIWDVRANKTIHVLKGHKEPVHDVAFSPDGTFAVTGSDDGTLKLWNVNNGSLIKTLKGHKDKVRSVAFTPNGKYILSGAYDKSIRLWDGRTGKFIKILANFNKKVAGLSISHDSLKVVVGNASKGDYFNCFTYSIPSGKKITSFTKHKNIVEATDISPDGRTAATGGGNDMEIYLWDLTTGKVKQKMVGKGKRFWNVGFAKDGRSIAWGRTWKKLNLFQSGPLEQTFQVKSDSKTFELSMGRELSSDIEYQGGIESAGPWSIRTKNGKIHKTLEILKNGRVTHEISREPKDGYWHESLTLTPDGQTVISGGGYGILTSYNPQTGKKIHKFIGHTGDVWGVAASPDSRFLVSGSADQTVRLWEIDTGKLLLSIFQGTDGGWVAWTPEGFFDCSSNGAKYIGYHINRGEDKAADYISVDQIFDQYYRPDLVAMKLEGGHDKEILAELEKVDIKKLIAGGVPPTIEFKAPVGGETIKDRDIKLKLALTDKGGGIGKIVYRINGVTIGAEDVNRGIKIVDSNGLDDKSIKIEKLITLQPGSNHIMVTAYNAKNEIESIPASIELFLKDVISEKPSLYILSIGINEYRDRALKLNYSVPDGSEFAKVMYARGKSLFENVKVETLFDKEASFEGIEQKFNKLSKAVKTNDVFILYIAGHGINVDGKYHFIPWEFIYKNEDSVRNNSLTQEKMQALLAKIPALKSVILLDTCNSGAFTKPSSRGLAEKTAMDKLMRATGRATIAASSESQVALEGYEGHGVFTYALLRALRGGADKKGNMNGEVSVNELAEYVSEEVPKLTFKKWGYEQFPMQNLYGRSFPIGLVE